MKLLPHYFKWIGLVLFVLGFVFGFDDFRQGYFEGRNPGGNTEIVPVLPLFFSLVSEYFNLTGLLFYILAKNKNEDEFAQKLRYESAFLVLIITIVVLMVIFTFDTEIQIKPTILLSLQMVGYLILRSVKRNLILAD